MGRPCSVCCHPDVQRISCNLLDGIPYRELQRTYGVHPSALTWHRQHHITAPLQRIAQAERAFRNDAERAEPVLVEMRRLNARALRILERAEAEDDLQVAVAAIHVARKNLELIGRLSGELNERPSDAGPSSGATNTFGRIVTITHPPYPPRRRSTRTTRPASSSARRSCTVASHASRNCDLLAYAMSTAKLLRPAGRVAGVGDYLPILSTREVAANPKQSTLTRSRHMVYLRASLASDYMHKRLLALVDELDLAVAPGNQNNMWVQHLCGTGGANSIVLDNLKAAAEAKSLGVLIQYRCLMSSSPAGRVRARRQLLAELAARGLQPSKSPRGGFFDRRLINALGMVHEASPRLFIKLETMLASYPSMPPCQILTASFVGGELG